MAVSDLFATKRRAHSRRFYFDYFFVLFFMRRHARRVACGADQERARHFCRPTVMARSAPKSFYNGPAWQACRRTYLELHPFCEDCLLRGILTPAEHVHHMIWLTPDNWRDPAVALNHANLRALCVSCHTATHSRGESVRRYKIDEAGHVCVLANTKQG